MSDYTFVKSRTQPEFIRLERIKPAILLTGGAGFVGHHCVEHLLKNTDWRIIILDNLNYAGNLNRITDIEIWEREKSRVNFIWHDLRSPISETTHQLIGPINYVWHLSAESHVDRSLENAVPFAQTNVVGTTNLLEYLKRYQPSLKKYIGLNTDEVFGPAPLGIYHKETDKFYPSNPYAASKAGQWAMEYAFSHAFGLPIVMVHSMNIYGERQHKEKFIPKTIRSILKGEKVVLHATNGVFSSRKWIHARNLADGLLFLTLNGSPKETYNIAGEENNVLEISNIISQVILGRDLKEKEIEIVDAHSQRPGHDLRYSLDDTKIRELGWSPPKTLKESLTQVVHWSTAPNNLKWLEI